MSTRLTETTQIESSLGRAVEVFLAHRTRLFRVALRVTGDRSIAEDVVQEAWLRWQRADRGAIQNSAAFLTTTTTRLAINVIQSARQRHETPAGSQPADLVDPGPEPALRCEQTASVEHVLAVLMARLSPAELAAYVLRRGFEYAYCDIAAALRTSVPNARQLVRRAQLHIEGNRGLLVDPGEHRLLTSAFLRASRTGDLTDLMRVLTTTTASRDCTRPSRIGPGVPPNARTSRPGPVSRCHASVDGPVRTGDREPGTTVTESDTGGQEQ